MDKKVVVIELNLDVDKYTTNAVALNKQIAELKKSQQDLKKSGQETSLQYQNNITTLQGLQTELRQTNKAIQDTNTANGAAVGSNEQLRAQLSVLTLQYNKLSEAERESTNNGKQMGEQVLSLSTRLKANEGAVGDGRRSVGEYGKALAGATGLLGILARAMGASEEVVRGLELSHSTLTKSIKDVTHITKLQSETEAEGIVIKEGQIAVTEEQTVVTETQTVVTGEAEAATAALNAEMLLNPAVAVIAGIVALVTALSFLKTATFESKEVNDAFNKSMDDILKESDKVIENLKKLGIEHELLTGKINKYQSDRLKLSLETNKTIQEEDKKFKEDQDKIREETQKSQDTYFQKFLDLFGAVSQKTVDIQTQSNSRLKSLQIAHNAEMSLLFSQHIAEQHKITDEQNEENKKNEEKLKEDKKKEYDAELADNKKLLRDIQDAKILSIKDEESRELAKNVLDHQRKLQEIAESKADNKIKFEDLEAQQTLYESNVLAIEKKFADLRKQAEEKEAKARIDKVKADAKEEAAGVVDPAFSSHLKEKYDLLAKEAKDEIKLAEDKAKAIERIEKAGYAATKEGINAIFEIKNNQREAEITGIENETKLKIDNLQKQADAGIITQDDFKTKENRINIDAAKKEADIKKKQFESNKKLSLIQIAIKTAEGVMTAFNAATPYEVAAYVALALATGALEAGVVESQKPPAFAKGGRVLSGEKISRSHGSHKFSGGDSIVASVKEGEVILNERHQQLLGGAETFRNIGVPGFADGGIVTKSVTSKVDSAISAQNQLDIMLRNLPAPIVIVQDINDAQGTASRVSQRADI